MMGLLMVLDSLYKYSCYSVHEKDVKIRWLVGASAPRLYCPQEPPAKILRVLHGGEDGSLVRVLAQLFRTRGLRRAYLGFEV